MTSNRCRPDGGDTRSDNATKPLAITVLQDRETDESRAASAHCSNDRPGRDANSAVAGAPALKRDDDRCFERVYAALVERRALPASCCCLRRAGCSRCVGVAAADGPCRFGTCCRRVVTKSSVAVRDGAI